MSSIYLRRKEAAIYIVEKFGIPCSYRTLAKLAVVGGGPPYRKAGRYPLYERDDLDHWAEDRMGPKQSSTSTDSAKLNRLPETVQNSGQEN